MPRTASRGKEWRGSAMRSGSRIVAMKKVAASWVTVAATLLGYLLGRAGLAFVLLGGLPELARLGRAVATAFSPDLGHLLAMAMAAFIAYNRLR